MDSQDSRAIWPGLAQRFGGEYGVIAGFVACYLPLVWLGYAFKTDELQLSLMWPAVGLLLAALYIAPFKRWPLFIALQLACEYAVGLFMREPSLPWGIVLFMLANSADAVVGALVARWRLERIHVERASQIVQFLLAAATGAAVSATVGAAIAVFSYGAESYAFQWQLWWVAIGLVTQFTIGGLSGVSHAIAPADTQQTDTYYIVAHFHYVLFGGALFGFMSGFYYWWPKAFGYKLRESLGKWNFWLMVIGFNLTFGPMHILGLQGMPRRMQTYDSAMGFNLWNAVATVGAFLLAVGTMLVLVNALVSYLAWKRAGRADVGPDPWDGRTLEWSVQSPTPAHNFDVSPAVTSLDDFWHRKYTEDENGKVRRVHTGDELAQPGDGEGVHLPAPSSWPFVLAVSLPIVGYGLIFNLWLVIPGAILGMAAMFGWALEPADDLDLPGHAGDHDHGDPGGDDGGAERDHELETV
jgi:cytochrome c oxidase subunit 1